MLYEPFTFRPGDWEVVCMSSELRSLEKASQKDKDDAAREPRVSELRLLTLTSQVNGKSEEWIPTLLGKELTTDDTITKIVVQAQHSAKERGGTVLKPLSDDCFGVRLKVTFTPAEALEPRKQSRSSTAACHLPQKALVCASAHAFNCGRLCF